MAQAIAEKDRQPFFSRSFLTEHPVVSYFVIAYAISWLIWLPLILSKGGGIGLIPLTTDANVDGLSTSSLIVFGSFGPAIAAVLMSVITEGRVGVRLLFRRMVRIRVGFQWYLLAVFLPLFPTILFLVLSGSLSLTQVVNGQVVIALLVYVLSVVLGLVLGSPLGEEPGWRGFALPRLQQQSGPLRASLFLGLLWGIWHLPLALFTVWGRVYQIAGIALSFPVFIIIAISYALIMTWLFNNTRGSIFMAILFHSAIDATSVFRNILFPNEQSSVGTESGPIVLLELAIIAAVWVIVAGIVLGITRGKLSYTPAIEQAIRQPAPVVHKA